MEAQFWLGLGVGVATGLVLSLVTGVTKAVLNAPRQLEATLRLAEREQIDRARWVARHQRELQEELRQVDEKHNARGTFDSGQWQVERGLVSQRYLDQYEDYHRQMVRRVQDSDLSWLAKQLYKVKSRKGDRTPLEEQVFGGLFRDRKPESG